MTVRVVLADDQRLILAGFRVLIESADDLEVVGEATTGAGAVELARQLRPDVVLMDIRMPELDGIEATRRITADEALSGVRILILTTFEIDENVLGALRAGASGFLSKGVEPSDLLDGIRSVARGESLLSPRATRSLIDQFLERPAAATRAAAVLDQLTSREREIVGLVARGLSNDEIAGRLFVSPLTVKTHINRSMTKLSTRDRAQLVMVAYTAGLVHP
jgi:DNA-binding NarL/FixJ family response regulator